jgi:hypothetical protein
VAYPAFTAYSSGRPGTDPAKKCLLTPDGADILIDGKYAASTPSTIQLAAGEHNVSVQKSGFLPWQKAITVSAGSNLTMSATLDKQ